MWHQVLLGLWPTAAFSDENCPNCLWNCVQCYHYTELAMSKISGEQVINNLQCYRVHIKGETKAGYGESMTGCSFFFNVVFPLSTKIMYEKIFCGIPCSPRGVNWGHRVMVTRLSMLISSQTELQTLFIFQWLQWLKFRTGVTRSWSQDFSQCISCHF